jgi:hypothetical protein
MSKLFHPGKHPSFKRPEYPANFEKSKQVPKISLENRVSGLDVILALHYSQR